ncbi:MAG TPA: CoA transferase [Caulobacteraceae bacterium]|nr:CoA transferase [Caulobacteraceae bacterium]
MSFPALAAPLAGLKVVETPGGLATRYCARLFAVLGAEVVRVQDDSEAQPDPLFAAWLDQGKVRAPSVAAAFDALGAGRSLVIAGQTQKAVEAAVRAAGSRDATLLALTWFEPGPYGDWRINDPLMQALTGCAYAFGERDGPPTLAQGHAPQLLGGLVGFIAALAGLMNPDRGPRRIDASIFEAALCFSETGAVATWASGFKSHRLGVNRYAPTYPGTIYETADGHVGITALTPAQWLSLCGLIERADLAADPRFRSTYLRLPIADEIDSILAPIFRRRTTDWWVEAGDRLRIPTAPALRPGDLPARPHWRVRESFATIGEGVAAPTLPYRFRFEGATAPRPAGGAAGPLAGVRVADFSMGWAGPLATRYLGDLGADVLKIESHARPDWWRGWEAVEAQDPPPHEVQRNFMAVNRSKRGLDLDLGDAAARAAAEAIVRCSDIVIDNQGPNVMDKLGLGPADQRRMSPAVISISMPPFGRSGPLAGLRAYGSTVEQASGMPFVNGRAAWAPSQQHVAYGDAAAGLYGAAAALIGLYARERLGGAEIDLCQVECLFQLGADAIIAEQARGASSARDGSRRRTMAPSMVARAAGEDEAWLAVCLDDDAGWPALCRVIGRDDLAADPALATLAGRKTREDEIEAAIAVWAAALGRREAAAALQAAGVSAAPVLAVHDLSADPQLTASGFWLTQERRYVGRHLTPAPPFRYDGARPGLTRPAPVLGEHTAEVLAELGIDAVTR